MFEIEPCHDQYRCFHATNIAPRPVLGYNSPLICSSIRNTYMIACLRLLSALCLAALLAACASSPSSSLGELPRTPNASIEQLLEQAASSKTPEQAAVLRLSAADLAYRQKDSGRASQILAQVPLDTLKPAQQVYASTLAAE